MTQRLQRLYEQAVASDLTYSEVGATAGELPDGWHHDRVVEKIGSGRAAFEAAARHMDAWGIQREVGFQPYPPDGTVEVGNVVIVTVPIGPLRFIAPARVVYVVREGNRHGFAYGTLPGHPEIGEEYFGLRLDGDDLYAEIVAFSRPGTLLARLGGPITRRLQKRTARAYVAAIRAAAARS